MGAHIFFLELQESEGSPAAQARLGRLGSQTSKTRWPRAPPVLGVWCFPFLTASCQKPWDFHGRDLSCFRL